MQRKWFPIQKPQSHRLGRVTYANVILLHVQKLLVKNGQQTTLSLTKKCARQGRGICTLYRTICTTSTKKGIGIRSKVYSRSLERKKETPTCLCQTNSLVEMKMRLGRRKLCECLIDEKSRSWKYMLFGERGYPRSAILEIVAQVNRQSRKCLGRFPPFSVPFSIFSFENCTHTR